jgi:hypothetical protein
MKIIVDKLPKHPKECCFHKYVDGIYNDGYYSCGLTEKICQPKNCNKLLPLPLPYIG